MADPAADVTDAELAVLRHLWDHGTATRRQITDALYPDGGPAHYTTVQKLLERLEAKGYVRSRAGRRRPGVHRRRRPGRPDPPAAAGRGRQAVRRVGRPAAHEPGRGRAADRRRAGGAAGAGAAAASRPTRSPGGDPWAPSRSLLLANAAAAAALAAVVAGRARVGPPAGVRATGRGCWCWSSSSPRRWWRCRWRSCPGEPGATAPPDRRRSSPPRVPSAPEPGRWNPAARPARLHPEPVDPRPGRRSAARAPAVEAAPPAAAVAPEPPADPPVRGLRPLAAASCSPSGSAGRSGGGGWSPSGSPGSAGGCRLAEPGPATTWSTRPGRSPAGSGCGGSRGRVRRCRRVPDGVGRARPAAAAPAAAAVGGPRRRTSGRRCWPTSWPTCARGDHWVRRLELVVLGVYWWFPVAWLAVPAAAPAPRRRAATPGWWAAARPGGRRTPRRWSRRWRSCRARGGCRWRPAARPGRPN